MDDNSWPLPTIIAGPTPKVIGLSARKQYEGCPPGADIPRKTVQPEWPEIRYWSGLAPAGAVVSVIARAACCVAAKIVPVVLVPNERVPPPAAGLAVAL